MFLGSHSAGQKFSAIKEPRSLLKCSQRPPIGELSEPVDSFTSYFCNIHFHVTIPECPFVSGISHFDKLYHLKLLKNAGLRKWALMMVFWVVISYSLAGGLALKIEAIRSFETLVTT
jgi:hypothetical protein